jgi:hypothetical protein
MLGSPVDQAPGHVQIPSRWAQFLIGVIDNLLGPIDEAIEAMEAAKKRTS